VDFDLEPEGSFEEAMNLNVVISHAADFRHIAVTTLMGVIRYNADKQSIVVINRIVDSRTRRQTNKLDIWQNQPGECNLEQSSHLRQINPGSHTWGNEVSRPSGGHARRSVCSTTWRFDYADQK
jgi:hypothetical protein